MDAVVHGIPHHVADDDCQQHGKEEASTVRPWRLTPAFLVGDEVFVFLAVGFHGIVLYG